MTFLGGKYSKLSALIQAVFIFIWISVLKDTDSLASIYVLCTMAAMVALYDRFTHGEALQGRGDPRWYAGILPAIVFSLAVLLANYPIFTEIRDAAIVDSSKNMLVNGVRACGVFLGGIVVAMNIITYALSHFPISETKTSTPRKKGSTVFFFYFGTFFVIYCAYLFLIGYPGNITYDSVSQITQIYNHEFISIHPFWHTMLIKLTMSLGYALFRDVNAAAACYSLCQLTLMAATFAYVITTLYEAGVPKWCRLTIFVMYAFLPYNIAYSMTMVKDVPFSLGILLFVTALFRCIRSLGSSRRRNYIVLFLGCLLMCLMRTNGIASLGITLVLMLPFLWKKDKKILIILLVVLIIACVLYGPVEALFPHQEFEYGFLEPMSVPIQQISRVVVDECPLSDDQYELLGKAINIDKIYQYYRSGNVDDIKLTIWLSGSSYLKDHFGQYIKLWFELGCKYPMEYLKAWVDQTKGYWNGGYNFGMFGEYVDGNSFGLYKSGGIGPLVKLKNLAFGFLRFTVVMEPFNSIGMHVWLLVLCWFLNLKKKRPELWLSVPLMVIDAGLIIGTPVYAEFRYIYALFITLPLILAVTVYRAEDMT